MARNLDKNVRGSIAIRTQSTDERWRLSKVEDTISLGKAIFLKRPLIKFLLLEGPLGAGKTTLVKGIAASLGIEEPITSPTFALSQHYLSGEKALIHLDLYRLENPDAANELFLQEEEEAKGLGAIMVVEWPERLSLDLPVAWKLKLQHYSNDQRIAHLMAPRLEDKNN